MNLAKQVRTTGGGKPGQATIMVAIMIAVLVGFVGLVVDAGTLYVMKGRLQNTVDAAALAGAQHLPNANDARITACEYIDLNSVSEMSGANCNARADVITSASAGAGGSVDTITVTAHRETSPTLMRVLGIVLPTNVGARATVKIGSVGQTCIFPLFLEVSAAPEVDQKYSPVQFTEPDAALIDDENPNNGSSAIRETMEDPCAYNGTAAVGDEMDIKNGSTTQFKDGWVKIRDAALSASSECQSSDLSDYLTADGELSPEITTENCPRIRLLPVVPDGDYGGNDTAEVIGFTPFFFGDICLENNCTYSTSAGSITVPKHKAWGYYLDMEFSSGTFSDYQEDLGTKIVVMSE